jgi:hypothetical protein
MKVEPDFGKQAMRMSRVPRTRLPQRIIRSWITGGVSLRNRVSLTIRLVAAKARSGLRAVPMLSTVAPLSSRLDRPMLLDHARHHSESAAHSDAGFQRGIRALLAGCAWLKTHSLLGGLPTSTDQPPHPSSDNLPGYHSQPQDRQGLELCRNLALQTPRETLPSRSRHRRHCSGRATGTRGRRWQLLMGRCPSRGQPDQTES